MKIIPIREYNIEIRNTSDEFIEQITNLLDNDKRNKYNFFYSYGSPFVGYIKENEFKIRRKSVGNIASIPITLGKVIEDGNKTILFLTIKFEKGINILLLFWFSLLLLFLTLSSVDSILTDNFNIGIIVIPILILISYGVLLLTFSYELQSIKRYFQRNLNIEIR